MPTILRGKRKGESFTMGQFCNDWVMDLDKAKVLNIASVSFTDEELKRITSAKETGFLFKRYVIYLDKDKNTFKRRKP